MRPICLLFLAAVPVVSQVKITQATDRISIDIDGKPFTAFYTTADVNKPYLHPLRSASGKVVTRFFPMEMVQGESHDHPHHRGLWFSHGDVNGFDFWANETRGGKKGRIVTRKIGELRGGKKEGVIQATFDWDDPDGTPLLTEQRRMVFYADPAQRTVDFDITLTALVPVKFGDTKEGTFALRLTPSLEEDHGGRMHNAEGAETEKNVWGKRSPWVDYFGEVGGEKLGIAIFDHPSNPRHPTWWHSRAYGLFAANPFGLHDFENDKTKDGSLKLDAKQTLRFRYRVVIHPGDYRTANIAAMWDQYAKAK